MPCAPSGLRQINAAQKQHEFFVAEDDFAFLTRGFRPAKTPSPETLGAHPKSAAVPEKQFQAVALGIGEEKDMPAQRIAGQPVPHQPVGFCQLIQRTDISS